MQMYKAVAYLPWIEVVDIESHTAKKVMILGKGEEPKETPIVKYCETLEDAYKWKVDQFQKYIKKHKRKICRAEKGYQSFLAANPEFHESEIINNE